MLSPLEKQNKLRSFIQMSNENLTRTEFKTSFDNVVRLIKLAITDLTGRIDRKLASAEQEITKSSQDLVSLKQEYKDAVLEVKKANETTFAQIKKHAIEGIDALFNRMRINDKLEAVISRYEAKIKSLDNKIQEVPQIDIEQIKKDVISLLPTPKEIDVRNKMELSLEENPLDLKYIGGLKDHITGIAKDVVSKHAYSGGGGASVSVLSSGTMKVQTASAFNFKGSGAPTVSIGSNGVTNLDFSATGSATWYQDEVLTRTDGTNYTLAHTPTAVVFLFLNGQLLPATGNYTRTGTAIALTSPTIASDTLSATYN